jgi:hypothetical protein
MNASSSVAVEGVLRGTMSAASAARASQPPPTEHVALTRRTQTSHVDHRDFRRPLNGEGVQCLAS